MKLKAVLGVASVFVCIGAWAGNYSELDPVDHSVQGLVQQIHKDVAFDPVLDVSPNLGHLSTEVVIPLPPHLLPGAALSLSYSSHNPVNQGLGIGWSWNLPAIQINFKNSKLAPFTAIMSGLSGEIARSSGESLSQLLPLLKSLSNDFFGVEGEFQAYRPVIDRAFHLFVEVVSKSNRVGWFVLTPSGERAVFDGNGLVIARGDRFGNSIRYQWTEGLLRRVYYESQGDKKWSVDIAYDSNRQPLPQFTQQGFFQLPLGLDQIKLPSRVVDFTYEDSEFLSRVEIRGGVAPLFTALYSPEERISDRLRRSEANSFQRHDDQVPYHLGLEAGLSAQKVTLNDAVIPLFVDLNGDGLTDKIEIDTSLSRVGFKAALEELRSKGFLWFGRPDKDKAHKFLEKIANLNSPARVFIAVNRSGKIEWVEEPSMHLGNLPLKRSFYVEDQEGIEDGIYSESRGVFFPDLNNDGRRDLVDCGFDRISSFKQDEIEEDPVTIDFGDGVDYVSKRTFSSLAQSILKLLGVSTFPATDFVDVFESSGNVASISILEPDAQLVSDLISKMPKEGMKLSQNHYFGFFHWQPQMTNLMCNSKSLFFDANKDGFVDVLTGKTLFLGSAQAGMFHPTRPDLGLFFEAAHSDAPSTDDVDFGVIDLDQDGRFEVTKLRGVLEYPRKGEIHVVRNGTTEIYSIPKPSRRMISVLKSPLGGEKKIHYALRSGQWVVEAMTSVAGGEQPTIRTEYEYISAEHDSYFNEFLGFWKIRKKITESSGHMKPQITESVFSQDNDFGAAVLSSRGRLSGLLLVDRDLDLENSKQPVLREERFRPLGLELSKNRIHLWNYTAEKVTFKPDTLSIVDRLKVISRLDLSLAPSGWAKSADGVVQFPIHEETENLGLGISSASSDALVNAKLVVRESFRHFESEYIRRLEKESVFGKDQKKLREDVLTIYDDQTTLPIKTCQKDRCSEATHDLLGRITYLESTSGLKASIDYQDATKLRSRITTPEGVEERTYDDATGLIRGLKKREGAQFEWDYTEDGRLKSMIRKSGLAPVVWASVDYRDLLSQKKLLVTSADQSSEHVYDGFGRLFYTLRPQWIQGEIKTVNSGETLYGIQGKPVLKSLPRIGQGSEPMTEWFYDSLGRVTEKRSLKTSAQDFLEGSRFAYDGICTEALINDFKRKGTCKNLMGQLQMEWEGSDQIRFKSDDLGDLIGVSSLGLIWSRNGFGEIIESQSDLEEVSSLEALSDWGLRERVYTHTGSSVETKEINDHVAHHDYARRLLRSKTSRSEFDGVEPKQFLESRLYEKGHLSERVLDYKETNVRETFSYDELGDLIDQKTRDLNLSVARDGFGRQTQLSVRSAAKTSMVNLDYDLGEIKKISAQGGVSVKKVEFDLHGRLSQVSFVNGILLEYRYQGNSTRIEAISLTDTNENRSLYSETLTENPKTRQLTGRKTVYGSKSENENFNYHASHYRLIAPNKPNSKVTRRDGRVTRLNGEKVEWSGFDLTGYRGFNLYRDADGAMQRVCSKDHCVDFVSEDHVVVDDVPVMVVRIHGKPVVALVDGRPYGLVSDHLGSVKVVFDLSESGEKSIDLIRHYGPWGEKKRLFESEEAQAAKLDSKIVWGFARLKEVSGLESKPGLPLYMSRTTRMYSPELREWMSADPSVVFDPDYLVGKPGNWRSLQYANGQPLEYLDPSGMFVVKVGGNVSANAGLGFSVSRGITASYSKEGGFKIGDYVSGSFGPVAGAPGGGVAIQGGISEAPDLKEGVSKSLTHGGSWGPGLITGADHTIDEDGNNGVSISIGGGGKGEVHQSIEFEKTTIWFESKSTSDSSGNDSGGKSTEFDFKDTPNSSRETEWGTDANESSGDDSGSDFDSFDGGSSSENDWGGDSTTDSGSCSESES